MALTSFKVRQTISDGGSSLRRTNVTQDSTFPNGTGDVVSDSGLRADDFFLPIPESFLESTFEANVYNRESIELNWQFGFTLVSVPTVTEPVQVMIRASNAGEPVTAGDGVLTTTITANSYRENYKDENTVYIKEGSWVYYSMFVLYQDSSGDGFYERVATLSVQIPRNFNSTEDLWKRVPAYYRELDADYVVNTSDYPYENGPLHRFIELFGWELDKIRTTIYDTMRINDPEVIHSSAIDALANQTGIEFTKNALGTAKLRAVLNSIGYLRRTKGTWKSIEEYISALSGCGVSTSTETTGGSGGIPFVQKTVFSVHPMRVNLITDPFLEQDANRPLSPDTGIAQRSWTLLNTGGREHGWGVYAIFSSDPVTDMTVSNGENKLTITLPALSGTATVLIYSRGDFLYNNNLTYYYSAITSHDFSPRFTSASNLPGLIEGGSAPLSVPYYDSWNDSVTNFPEFQDSFTNGARTIMATIPKVEPVLTPISVVPVYKFNITLSGSSSTILTFEKPMVEYSNSSGEFFTGNEPSGGFIPDSTGDVGAGLYDYHWGPNADSSPHEDFSYYTIDFARVKAVVDNVLENNLVPVTFVKNTDYEIRWDVLE
jgi:hypothetical protein